MSDTTTTPVAPDAPATAAPASVTGTLPPPDPASIIAPAPRRSRKKLVLAIVIPVGAFLLIAGGLAAAFVAGREAHSPQHAVSAFLDELVAGHAEAALAQADPAPTADLTLATDEVYAALDERVTKYEVLTTAVTGDDATVKVQMHTGSNDWEDTLDLHRTGSDGLFDVWALDGTALPTLSVTYPYPQALAYSINGVDFEPGEGGNRAILAFPGSYTLTGTGDFAFGGDEPIASMKDEHFTVKTLNGERAGGIVRVTPDLALTDAGKAKAVAAVNAWVDACVASGGSGFKLSDECGALEATPEAGDTYKNIRWSLISRPGYELSEWYSTGWPVATTDPGGTLRWDADFTNSRFYGQSWVTFTSYYPSGLVTFGDDGKLVFEPDPFQS